MSRRAHSLPPGTGIIEKPERSRCLKAVCISWKVITCIVSHVTLVSMVVAYCIGGALLFQHLEGEHELEVKRNIKKIRNNVTDDLWKMTAGELFLEEDNWTELAFNRLEKFEKEILKAVKTEGWDGDEREQQLQWTFFGALFYSIIVITTIGYGHIAPRTDWGKVTTIFYAILGIPLMLLCLSNIGDVMASSFRFLYWKICCYACTREPRTRRSRSVRGMSRQTYHRYSSRSQPPPVIRRSIRVSQRSADSGYDASLIHAHSDPELRYNQYLAPPIHGQQKDWRYSQNGEIEYGPNRHRNQDLSRNYYDDSYQPRSPNSQRFTNRVRNRGRLHDRHSMECERSWKRSSIENLSSPMKRTLSSKFLRPHSVGRDTNISQMYSQTIPSSYNRNKPQTHYPKVRAKSVDPKLTSMMKDENISKTPILCNKYALEDFDKREIIETGNDRRNRENRWSLNERNRSRNERERNVDHGPRSLSVPHQQPRYGNKPEIPQIIHPRHMHEPPGGYHYDYDEDFHDEFEMKPMKRPRRSNYHAHGRKEKSAPLPPSPRIMSPMGFAVHRQTRMSVGDDDSYYDDDEWDSYADYPSRSRPVPIWLCVFLVISYIIAGAFLFSNWEKWPFLDSVYFCFITLTTIGFGDFVPAQGVKENSKESIALCSLYLLFGISLLAMSFNLVQEEVIANVKEIARRLGILKEEDVDD